ncbi:flavodoxin FldA [Buchnera aphidicola]|uniref:Flavodoxin n=1 Tax=Buchnera aphidicola (Sarucallis kahawaluokalani) TaxID=1241878 RepID=A0A4D6Y8L1_9GAMM|nr:flavodoxin FldA [Buchnera aphidicola]QCI25997.1 flavodoxin FldA [Buchnera aphidicola (Sarucallis kahawaluokalani)]
MKKIGIFFGSDTGNTEKIAKKIHNIIGPEQSEIYDIANATIDDIKRFDILMFGIPTWYYGELQCDWDEFILELKKMNFKNNIIALFGCGDQEDYSEYFCDGMGIIYNILKERNAKIIGTWPKDGYQFEASKALIDKNNFVGLVIDEDRQPEKSKMRIQNWIKQVLLELKKISI